MFQMHRIFCATPWELEAERSRFDKLVGKFNEATAAEKGVLFVPVSLVNIRDKRPVQYAVEDNIEQCRYYLLVLKDGWGPVERNFQSDYELALQAAKNPALPMRTVVILAKTSPGCALNESSPVPDATYSTMAEFEERVDALLAGWFEALLSGQHADASNA
jgi:hypothetical protein